jgi:hypothetical protein
MGVTRCEFPASLITSCTKLCRLKRLILFRMDPLTQRRQTRYLPPLCQPPFQGCIKSIWSTSLFSLSTATVISFWEESMRTEHSFMDRRCRCFLASVFHGEGAKVWRLEAHSLFVSLDQQCRQLYEAWSCTGIWTTWWRRLQQALVSRQRKSYSSSRYHPPRSITLYFAMTATPP